MGPTGCCATPPGIEWSDIGRIVMLGGRDFLLTEIAAGRLRKGPRGLFIQRVDAPDGEGPKRCTYHGPQGCTIPPDRRAATCNYYVCEDALAQGGDPGARRVLGVLVEGYGACDRLLASRVVMRWPDGPPWDDAFLDWLRGEFVGVATSLLERQRLG